MKENAAVDRMFADAAVGAILFQNRENQEAVPDLDPGPRNVSPGHFLPHF
jgi:hypothetical protein